MVVWEPSVEEVERAEVTAFARWVEETRSVRVTESYDQLWRWSADDVEGFWRAVWERYDVQASGRATAVLSGREMPGATWFEGVSLNYAEHVFREDGPAAPAARRRARAALRRRGPRGRGRVDVGRAARADRADRDRAAPPRRPARRPRRGLPAERPRDDGRLPGDRAPSARCGPRRRRSSARSRSSTASRRSRRRSCWRSTPTATAAAATTGRGRRAAGARAAERRARRGPRRRRSWDALTAGRATPLAFARMPFDHPLWVLYSSGTTGLPKPIVHGHGGMLLEHLKLGHLHLDARARSRLLVHDDRLDDVELPGRRAADRRGDRASTTATRRPD